MHWILAFDGALIHVLLKVQEVTQDKKYVFGTYFKKNWASLVATAIMIPVLLIVLSDTSLSEILPINHVTALLAGYQTNSLFKSVIGIGKKRMDNAAE